jgi:PAS domain S-box-containing protein
MEGEWTNLFDLESAPDDCAPDHFTLRANYHEVFDFEPDAHLLTDRFGLIMQVNHASTRLFNCSKEFLIDKPLPLFAQHNRRRFYKSLGKLRSGQLSDEFESRVGLHLGSVRDVSIVARTCPNRYDSTEQKFHWFLRDITDWKAAEANRAELLALLASAQENERRQFSRELHDTIGQSVTALSLGLKALRRSLQPTPAVLGQLNLLEQQTNELGRQLHELVTRLRPTVLDDLGLVEALHRLIKDWTRNTGVPVEFHSALPSGQRLPTDVETALYRIVQESLTNVARHAHARHVSVVLEQLDGFAVAVVEDNGQGFDADTAAKGRLGLLGMRERLAVLGGILAIESERGSGTTVIARIPTKMTLVNSSASQGKS